MLRASPPAMLDDGLLGVHSVLPEQMMGTKQTGARYSSIHRLMLGILWDAIDLYRKACDPRRRMSPSHRREVLAWFTSRDRRWLFSFERICEALELNSEYLRRGLDQVAHRPDGRTLSLPLSIRSYAPRQSGGLPDRLGA